MNIVVQHLKARLCIDKSMIIGEQSYNSTIDHSHHIKCETKLEMRGEHRKPVIFWNRPLNMHWEKMVSFAPVDLIRDLKLGMSNSEAKWENSAQKAGESWS